MKKFIPAMRRVRPIEIACVAIVLAACTGNVGDGPGSEGSSSTGGAGSAGNAPPQAGGRGGTTVPGAGASGVGAAGGSPGVPEELGADLPQVKTTRFARLTHGQWENAVRDLLRLDAASGISSTFVGDPAPGRFDGDGNTLQVTTQLRTDYEAAAEKLADQVATTPAALAKIMPPNLPTEATARRRGFLQGFGLRAYRRPLTDAELTKLDGIFTMGATIYKGADPFVDGVRLTLRALLQSPHFVYRTERGAAGAPLDQHEVAAKLALTTARTIPDDALLAAAAGGKLKTDAEVRAQAERLLGNGRLETLVEDFHHQALRLKAYPTITKDTRTFPEFVSGLGADMRGEVLAFAREVVTNGGSFADLMTAPYTFVNKRTAGLYKLSGNFGDQLQKTQLDPGTRAGLLTQLGFLASHAGSIEVDTGLIHRGVAVMREFLCTEINPPGDIDFANLPEGKGPTNRARMDDITSAAGCKSCHHPVINPLGGAFEVFDAVGRHRTTERDGAPITTAGKVDIGVSSFAFDGPVQLAGQVARDPMAQFCYAGGWLEYLHGHLLGHADAPLVRQLASVSREGKLPVKQLVLELVTTAAFLTRQP